MRRSTPTLRLALWMVFLVSAAVGVTLAATAGAQGVPTADLAIVSNTASVKHAKVGDEVTFRIIATNNGPEPADSNVSWASGQMQLVSETCDLGISPDTPFCEYGIRAPGVTLTTTVVGRVLDTGSDDATSTACVVEQSGFIEDPDPQNNCAAATVKIVGKR